jgi:hypothetical protein
LSWEHARARVAAVPAVAFLALIVAVSAVVRFVLAFHDPAPFIFQDELLYSELAKSLGTTGHFAARGAPGTLGVGPAYPALISPAYAVFGDLAHAYAGVKAINSALMSLAAVPVYLIGRRLLPPVASLAAAAITLAMPWLVYSTLVMTENGFYLVFICWFLALVLTLERPTIPRQLATLILLGIAYETRYQALALVPALATAVALTILGNAWFGSTRTRRRALLAGARSFWLTWAALAVGVVGFVAIEIGIRGRSVSDSLFRSYSKLGGYHYPVGTVLKWFSWHVAELDLAVGVLPFAGLLVLVAVALRRAETSSALRAFAAAAVATSFWLILVAAAFASTPLSQRIQERALFYLVPIFVIALVAWAVRGLGRDWRLTAGAALLAGGLVGIVPYSRFIGPNTVNDTLSLVVVQKAQEKLGVPSDRLNLVIILVAAAAAAVFLLLPRRWALVAPALVLVYFAVANRPIETATDLASRGSLLASIQGRRDWVDKAVGPHARVAELYTYSRSPLTLWNNEFFNRSVGPVYNFNGATDGLPQQTVATDPTTGRIVLPGGRPVPASYLLTDTTLLVHGERVADDPAVGMALYRIDGPVRLDGRISGLYQDHWSGPTVSFVGYDCRGGSLSVRLTGDPTLQPKPQTVVATSGSQTLARIVVRPHHFNVPFSVPLAAGGGACLVTFTVSPTAVPAQVYPSADTRTLGIRFTDFVYRPR